MNLDKCLHACRAAGLSKDRRKTLKDRETSVHFVKDNNKWRETATTTSGGNRQGQAGSGDRLFDSKKGDRLPKECMYCGRRHAPGREKCLAYCKKCNACQKMNHFKDQCQTRPRVNALGRGHTSARIVLACPKSVNTSPFLRAS